MSHQLGKYKQGMLQVCIMWFYWSLREILEQWFTITNIYEAIKKVKSSRRNNLSPCICIKRNSKERKTYF